jgi:trimeric autotransporter adhesin
MINAVWSTASTWRGGPRALRPRRRWTWCWAHAARSRPVWQRMRRRCISAMAQGAPVVTYAGLKVWDADGKVLPSRFLAGPSGGIILRVDESSARYPITIDPIAQQAYLKPSAVGTTQAGDNFGYSVAVSGDTVVVGAYLTRTAARRASTARPTRAPPMPGRCMCSCVAGRRGASRLTSRPAKSRAGDNFGISVAVSGDTLVVGANLEDSSTTGINSTPNESAAAAGAVYVFVRSGTTWSQQAYLKASQVTVG